MKNNKITDKEEEEEEEEEVQQQQQQKSNLHTHSTFLFNFPEFIST